MENLGNIGLMKHEYYIHLPQILVQSAESDRIFTFDPSGFLNAVVKTVRVQVHAIKLPFEEARIRTFEIRIKSLHKSHRYR